MVKTGYENLSDKKLFEMFELFYKQSTDYIKKEKVILNIKSDDYIKGIFKESFLLSERFIELYKDNKWRYKDKNIDEYFLQNLQQIASKAGDLEKVYGKEKYEYFETFSNWEDTYAVCRQYCIDLTELFPLVIELKQRFTIEKVNKPDNLFLKFIKYIFDKILAILSLSKGI